MDNKTRVTDFENDKTAYESLLADAAKHARNDFEIDFVGGLAQRFDEYGMDGFLSQKQYDILLRVAKW